MTWNMTNTDSGLWKVFMQKMGLWMKKVEKGVKSPCLQGFCPQFLWKSPWIMWKNPVEKVDSPVNSELYMQFAVCTSIWIEL